MGTGLDQQRQRRLSPDLQDVRSASRHWQRAVQLEQVWKNHCQPTIEQMPVRLAERRPGIQVLVEGSAAISPCSTVLSRGPSHAAAGDPPAALDLPGLQGAALAPARGPAGKPEHAEIPSGSTVVQPQRSTSPSRQGQGWSHRLQGHTPQQELPGLFGLWPQQQVPQHSAGPISVRACFTPHHAPAEAVVVWVWCF